MRGWRLGITFGAIVGAALVGACALDETGTTEDGGGPDVITVDVTTDAGNDATADVVGSDGDAQTFDVLPDVPPPPTCSSGTTCLPTLPSGFKYVEYEGTSLSACSSGYGPQQDLRENAKAVNNGCTCACNPAPTTPPTCTCGGTTAAFDILSGSNCPNPSSPSEILASTSCYKTLQGLSGNNDAIVAKPDAGCTASGGSCGSATATASFTSTSDAARRCDPSAAPATCTGGSCIPTPSGGYKLCVTNGSPLASCPANFPNAHLVGTSVDDSRICSCPGGCALAKATCGTPTLTLYGSNDCTTGAAPSITADGTSCQSGFGVNPSWGSAKYASTPSGATCGVSGSPAITGAVSLSGAYTICCQ